jgi:hypothetical protein
MISLIDMLQHVQKVDAVLIVSENSLLFVAAGGDVIDSTCIFNAKGARHTRTLAQKREECQNKRPDPNFDPNFCHRGRFPFANTTQIIFLTRLNRAFIKFI